jgi:hypothetical protein
LRWTRDGDINGLGDILGRFLGFQQRFDLFQSLLEGLHVATLRAALSPLFIIGASMAEARTSTTAGSHAITLELALPTYHAGQSLWLGNAGIVGDIVLRCGVVSIGVVASRSFMTASGRSVFW